MLDAVQRPVDALWALWMVPVHLSHGYLVGAVVLCQRPVRPLNQAAPALSLGPLAPRPLAALICCLPQGLLLGQEAILLASGTEKAYYPARKYKAMLPWVQVSASR